MYLAVSMAKYKQSDYEVLRRRCVELHQLGWKQGPIAQALGLTQGWVSQTLKKYREQGPAALPWKKPTGAPTRMRLMAFTDIRKLLSHKNAPS
ncbi:helix-turn-helix domain-containing protein [Spirosoma linguale]|uniref:Uncharacterized protein n=1 Tax=Spirosoma linguale (strain ATCC 33905 / DSM 74 / LMG 10896 / Claus 1) TaxID=504472 RepID=D2QBX7_SPILD|nr:hypothetical protein Slin_3710 [Spirosoma linguale DSM 74]